MIWLQFALCLAAIAVAGYHLCRYADVIAEKTGLTGSWVGIVLLATVTSLPELVTGITSVTVAQVPDIAVGNVLGACVLNLFFIVFLDFMLRGESLYSRVAQGHILAAALGVLMLGFTGFSILLGGLTGGWTFGHVSFSTPVIVALYALAIRVIHRHEQEQFAQLVHARVEQYESVSLRRALTGYGLAAVVVVGAALWLPFVARTLAEQMGWSQSFVGTLLVAVATTAPEAAVTFSALRMGALDMAIANLLGSNLFNILILAVDDLFYLPGSLLAAVSDVHAVSALTAVMMSGVAIVGVFLRARARLLNTVGWTSLALLALYVLNSYLLYRYAG
jgi:cation:H+ antiporter